MRKLKSWLDGFIELTQQGTSPWIFCLWGGIACIAGAMERKTWVTTMGRPVYPNLYTILVGPSGVGKTFVTDEVRMLWLSLIGHRVARSSVNYASIIDELRQAERHIITPGKPIETYHSLKVCSNEMQVMIPEYDHALMAKLTDIYDNKSYGESRRSKAENTFDILKPQINFLAATTPKYMNSVMPEGAWDLGFLSRCIIIFSGERRKISLFQNRKSDPRLLELLKNDLDHISKLGGEYTFSDEAANRLDSFFQSGGPERPDHPKLSTYNERRHFHLTKLMMVSAAIRTDALELTEEDYSTALQWMIQAERAMPEVFKAMVSSGDSKIVEDCHYAMFKNFLKNKVPIPQEYVTRFISSRAPAYSVKTIIDNMVQSGYIKPTTVPGYGTCYIPLNPNEMEQI